MELWVSVLCKEWDQTAFRGPSVSNHPLDLPFYDSRGETISTKPPSLPKKWHLGLHAAQLQAALAVVAGVCVSARENCWKMVKTERKKKSNFISKQEQVCHLAGWRRQEKDTRNWRHFHLKQLLGIRFLTQVVCSWVSGGEPEGEQLDWVAELDGCTGGMGHRDEGTAGCTQPDGGMGGWGQLDGSTAGFGHKRMGEQLDSGTGRWENSWKAMHLDGRAAGWGHSWMGAQLGGSAAGWGTATEAQMEEKTDGFRHSWIGAQLDGALIDGVQLGAGSL